MPFASTGRCPGVAGSSRPRLERRLSAQRCQASQASPRRTSGPAYWKCHVRLSDSSRFACPPLRKVALSRQRSGE